MKREIGEKKEHFSIRKLTVGAASVLIGTSLYLGGQKPVAVHADTDDSSAKVTEVKADQNGQKSKQSQPEDKKDNTASGSGLTKANVVMTAKNNKGTTIDKSKENSTSVEPKKDVQGSEQKKLSKEEEETVENDKKNTSEVSKENKSKTSNSTKKDNKNQKSNLDGPTDIDTINKIEQLINDNIGKHSFPVNQTITYYYPDNSKENINQYGNFMITLQSVKIDDPSSLFKYGYKLLYFGGYELNGETSYIYNKLLEEDFHTNGGKDQILQQIKKFKDDCYNKTITLKGFNIKQIKGYTAWSVSNTQEVGKNELKAIFKDVKNIPDWSINNGSLFQNIEIRYRPETVQPTSPQPDNPSQPQPTQAPSQPQPTNAPVHPEQSNEPGNVKPKPEKPTAPHHPKSNNGTVKPKPQKAPSKTPARKAVAKPVVKTTTTVAPKAQTPAKKPAAAKAALPQTGENKSVSTAAILLGGAAVVVGLIGLAATRKHIF